MRRLFVATQLKDMVMVQLDTWRSERTRYPLSKTQLKDMVMVQLDTEKSKRDRLQSSTTNDVARPIDTDKLSAALTAAIRILRQGTTAQAKVTRRGDAK